MTLARARSSLLVGVLGTLLPALVAAAPSDPRLGVATRHIEYWEQMLHGVESSDAIVGATIESASEEMAEYLDGDRSGEHVLLAYANVTIKEVFLGPDDRIRAGARIPIVIASERLAWFDLRRQAKSTMLLFLRKVEPTAAARTGSNTVLTIGYANILKAFVPGEGALELGVLNGSRVRQDVRVAVTASQPAQLVKLADVVVRGHHEGGPSICDGNSAKQVCANIVVDELLFGEIETRQLAVFTPVPGYVREDAAVYFLKQTAEGSFEVVGLTGGIKPVNGQVIGRRRDNLATVRRDLATADVARKRAKRP